MVSFLFKPRFLVFHSICPKNFLLLYFCHLLNAFCRVYRIWGFPGGSDGKESAYNAGDPGLIARPGRIPGEWNGYPLQYPCLENPMDRGAGQATVHGVAKESDMT